MNKLFDNRGFAEYLYWQISRRIDDENRLVYDIENDMLIIKSCKGHY